MEKVREGQLEGGGQQERKGTGGERDDRRDEED